jgi:hypothetical protein
MPQLQRSLLAARAAWLVGVCGGRLPPGLWAAAAASLIAHFADPDLVVALTAVSAAMALCSSLLEQQQARTSSPCACYTRKSTCRM